MSGKGYQTKEHFDGDGGAVAAQYDGFACMNVLFVAGGSGVAPLRSCIEAGVALELPQRATLYYGVRDDSVLAYQDKFEDWSKNFNVDVVTCFSQGSGGAFKGYVQDAIKAKGVAVPRNTGAAVCGPKDMFTATATKPGLSTFSPPSREGGVIFESAGPLARAADRLYRPPLLGPRVLA